MSHLQSTESTHLATVFPSEGDAWDDSGNYIGGTPLAEDIEVRYSSGGQGWVQADSGQQVHRNPTLDWPTDQADVIDGGDELALRRIDEPAPETTPEPGFVVENVLPTFGAWKQLQKLDIEISSI